MRRIHIVNGYVVLMNWSFCPEETSLVPKTSCLVLQSAASARHSHSGCLRTRIRAAYVLPFRHFHLCVPLCLKRGFQAACNRISFFKSRLVISTFYAAFNLFTFNVIINTPEFGKAILLFVSSVFRSSVLHSLPSFGIFEHVQYLILFLYQFLATSYIFQRLPQGLRDAASIYHKLDRVNILPHHV